MPHRYKLLIEYDGAPFKGWQRQDGVPTIQAAIEDALKIIINQNVLVEGSGRTDAGVHALGQVAHFEVQEPLDTFKLREGLNFFLKPHISILEITEAAPDFHARFSGIARTYEYHILNRRAHGAISHERCWHVMVPLDVNPMHEAAQHFVGRHDFSAFRAAECQANSPIKNLTNFNVWREGEWIKAEVKAPSFCHNQVRIMMGTLKLIGEGKWQPEKVSEFLISGDRTQSGPTAPPYGLYFKSVDY
jgi:tRNA pseudouridine38-40 synthase